MTPGEQALLFDSQSRSEIWALVLEAIEHYDENVSELRVAPASLDPHKLRNRFAALDFERPWAAREAVEFAVDGLTSDQVHTPHPSYFGLYNPASTTMGAVGDALVAAFNPQLAAWSHNPFANEIGMLLILQFAAKFGLPPESEGTLTSGGAEANQTALLVALAQTLPEYQEHGLRGLKSTPIIYASEQGHHSMVKAARVAGLGSSAIRSVPIGPDLRLDPNELEALIQDDLDQGNTPFFVVATAGSTSAGSIDPLVEVASIAARHKLWLHVDAAWGGAVRIVPELANLLEGIELADSVTFDPHKFMSVPMGCGMFLTRHRGALGRTFGITTAYMPKDAAHLEVSDPYTHSMQWSRRFTGLKLFLSLAVAGWSGYADTIRWQIEMGKTLAKMLTEHGWVVVNSPDLAVVCFVDGATANGHEADYIAQVAKHVVASGQAWISPTRLYNGAPALRACITNYRTSETHLKRLIESLQEARFELANA